MTSRVADRLNPSRVTPSINYRAIYFIRRRGRSAACALAVVRARRRRRRRALKITFDLAVRRRRSDSRTDRRTDANGRQGHDARAHDGRHNINVNRGNFFRTGLPRALRSSVRETDGGFFNRRERKSRNDSSVETGPSDMGTSTLPLELALGVASFPWKEPGGPGRLLRSRATVRVVPEQPKVGEPPKHVLVSRDRIVRKGSVPARSVRTVSPTLFSPLKRYRRQRHVDVSSGGPQSVRRVINGEQHAPRVPLFCSRAPK